MTIKETVDFLLYLFDAKTREELREVWLAKDIEMTLSDYINKEMNKHKPKTKTQSVEEDKKAIELAESIMSIPLIDEGGG
ncbi:hypothetical protein [Streptococcus parauberis]|uniref:Uncharacterized protein n=1 Tax=Streptococcus parauberis TaxID=1348 RepID=A0A854WIH5_9STRE|nr:hypothetical protein [Streptococcus parauberis]KYP21708.1 hypothetical protein AKL14_00619 [Streptococcus parauberis]KYP21883.1 hypothetical protein AKL13_00383 [Streptococcus parauberis]KYP21900.1 hypothetical protein TN39_00149 [Streptococcus parauberis]KYP23774.1 hypothetical protein ADO04_01650 [Streptococcus parauberis]KYP25313.1 hypothetical protein TP84_01615 [Streptococcus parauberis]